MDNDNPNPDGRYIKGLDAYERRLRNFGQVSGSAANEHVSGDCSEDKDYEARLQKMLEIAHDSRKLEIELYWKRSAYYWAFFAVLGGGYTWSVEKEPFLSVIFALLGVFFAMGWRWATLGSKYWQENWEAQVEALEILSRMPVHSIRKMPEKRCLKNALQSYPYSVSKINHSLSCLTAVGWVILFFYSLNLWEVDCFGVCKGELNNGCDFNWLLLLWIAIFIILIVVIECFARWQLSSEVAGENSGNSAKEENATEDISFVLTKVAHRYFKAKS